MNYYEELGIRPDADEEEIRKAHRRLVKLMHPDQHRDQGMKQLAETQMRRLNSIVATLLDPEERREYDEQLRGGDALNAAPHQSTWRSVPWWIASTLGAIVLTVAAVWFFADRIGSSWGPRNPPKMDVSGPGPEKDLGGGKDSVTPIRVQPQPPKTEPQQPTEQNPAVASAKGSSPETATVTSVTVPGPKVEEKPKPKSEEIVKATTLPPATAPPKPVVNLAQTRPKPVVDHAPEKVLPKRVPPQGKEFQTTHLNPPTAPVVIRKFPGVIPPVTVVPKDQPVDVANLRPPPAVAGPTPIDGSYPTPTQPPPPPPHSRDPVEGEWVYAPTAPEKQKPGFYPPEFIQLKLRKDTSGMRGEYSARYNVADNRPVSPNVNFVLKAVDDKAMKYTWTSADGSHGWFVIRQLEPDTMRLEWRDTSRRNGQALTSGMATLVRKN